MTVGNAESDIASCFSFCLTVDVVFKFVRNLGNVCRDKQFVFGVGRVAVHVFEQEPVTARFDGESV